ncbi:trifunctional histidinol dehydrogenase, partial [Cladochytrium tenue]
MLILLASDAAGDVDAGSGAALAAPAVLLASNNAAGAAAAVAPLRRRGCDQVWTLLPAPASDSTAATYSADIVSALDAGAAKVVVPLDLATAAPADNTVLLGALESLPADRLLARLSATSVQAAVAASALLTGAVSGLVVDLSGAAADAAVAEATQLRDALKSLGRPPLVAVELPTACTSVAAVAELDRAGVDVVVPTAAVAPGSSLDAAAAFAACLKTDRPDGLFATVVVDEQGVALGLAYSSRESIAESMRLRQGVYQSRTRGLWYKGQTSGATQALRRIRFDCDRDTLQFVVEQSAPGFCHLNTRTCFGADSGITALASLLESRRASAPAGSYTRRLFDDAALLRSKLIEEAHELGDAETPDDIAWEAADLIYFTLARCAAAGVSLADVERELDRRAMKVTRRPGNAKPQFMEAAKEEASPAAPAPVVPTPAPVAAPSPAAPAPALPDIKMQTFKLAELTAAQRAALLRRPAINTDAVEAIVRPIVADVAARGDAALRELTARLDGARPAQMVLRAPFDASLTQGLDDNVRAAIDAAHDNILAFHAAQAARSTPPLEVETAPGVRCARVARAVERVGLYVPGGTAVLPSTCLMLGVPARVAGCREIVVASPPRRDGTPVPEVVYVAQKVGATAIVLAGGAQAVAAMAFGTESVPKVDKIVGPGNQFVTVAKMLLQNDNRAMISIDMPAGPSELL